MDETVRRALDAMARRDWDTLKTILHPYVRWTEDGTLTRGRVNVLAKLADRSALNPPATIELRDGQIYGWTVAPIEVELLPPTASSDAAAIARITALVNEVYKVAEDGLWLDGADRTDARDVAALVSAGQIAVARLDGEIVGSVKIQRLDAETGEFGVLAADPAHRGIGIGRELVRFAEHTCWAGGANVMQLELLVPRTWSHPSKQRLDAWYTRLGYRPMRSGTAEETHPALAPLLATPCDFVTYQKPLRA